MEEIIEAYKTYIRDSANYGEFYQYLHRLTNHEKGVLHEILAKQYFTVYAKLYNVERYCARILGDVLPEGVNDTDLGSDGVIVHTDGRISLVQVKFRKNWEEHLNRLCLSGMSLEALALGDTFANLYLFSNTLFTPRNLSTRELARVRFVLADKLMECDWDLIRACDIFTDARVDVVIPPLRDWQVRAREFVLSPDVVANSGMFGRKTVVAACGAGKTLFTNSLLDDWYGSILILVPNLHLLSQWFEKLALWRPDYHFLLVGSDLDDEGAHVPYNLTTDVEVITNVYAEHMLNIICISTYQSLPRLIETESAHFDLCVCDEAHITAGSSGVYSLPTQEHFIAENILYITATPRIYGGAARETYRSMDDEGIYGPQFLYSFRQAINEEIISDYRIIVGQGQGQHDNTVFNAKFLKRSIVREGLNSVLVFSSSHAQSQELYTEFKRIFKGDHALILMPPGANSFRKAQVIHKLNTGSPVVIFNVRVFNLGSDLVPLQAVMLSGNKGSVTDIIQSVSRCLRLHPDKEYGTILVPCLVETEDFNGPGTFARLRSFLSAIASVDDSIKEEIILRAQRKEVSKRKIYTDMVMRSSEDAVDNVDFDVRMYTSVGNSVGFSPELRFAALKEFCEKEGRLPKHKEEHANVKIGHLLNSLLCSKQHAKTRDAWIQELRDISKITDILDARISNLANEMNKASRAVPPMQRFALLKEFCLNKSRLPFLSETYAGVRIGNFLSMLLGGKVYAETRDAWIQELRDIPGIAEALDMRLSNHSNEGNNTSRKIAPQKRFEALKDFCVQENRLPIFTDIHEGLKIGQFFNTLLGNNSHKKMRDTWIRELQDIPEIVEVLNARISERENEIRKASRKITPQQKFEILKTFCAQEGRLPSHKEVYADVKLGQFFIGLLVNKSCAKTRDAWIQELRNISDITDVLDARISNLTNESKKASRSITPQQRFEVLKTFCAQEGRLPSHKEIYANVKLGQFFNCLLSGKYYSNTRNTWLQELQSISDITDALDARIAERTDETKKASRTFSPAQRFSLLKEFCINKSRLPLQKETYAGVRIGNFLGMLLGGKNYMKTRDTWIQELLDVPEITDALDTRIAELADETKKASRAISPVQRFALLKEFCLGKSRLPIAKDIYAGAQIGQFLNMLLGGKNYMKTRDVWIQELLDIPEITEELKARLEKRGQSVPGEPDEGAETETETDWETEEEFSDDE